MAGIAAVVVVVTAAVMVWMSTWRHLHVDEAHNVFTMQLAMAWGDPMAGSPVELFHVLGGLVTRTCDAASEQYGLLRLLWAVLCLATTAVAGLAIDLRLPGFSRWMGAVVATALTLVAAPLWRHGFEIRHDVILGAGAVVLTGLCQRAERTPTTRSERIVAIVVVVLMQLDSHKAMTLWGPALLLLAWRESRHGGGRRAESMARASARFAVLGVVGGGVGFAAMALAGALPAYLDRLVHFAHYAAAAERFWAWPILLELVTGAPALTALAAVGLFIAVQRARATRGAGAGATLDAVPSAPLMLLVAVSGIVMNPTPYPYNLTWLVLCLAMGALAGVQGIADGHVPGLARWSLPRLLAVALAVDGACLVAFWAQPWAQTSMEPQVELIEAVEALTGIDDRVLDGAGLVATRRSPTRDWVLHSLFMAEYLRGEREHFADVIAREAPPVVLTGNFRWKWLPPADLAAVRARYVAVTPGLNVLGVDLVDPQDAVVAIARAGRYDVSGDDLVIDGVAGAAGPRQLEQGTVLVSGTGPVRLGWVGPIVPSLSSVSSSWPSLATSPSRRLFLSPNLSWRPKTPPAVGAPVKP